MKVHTQPPALLLKPPKDKILKKGNDIIDDFVCGVGFLMCAGGGAAAGGVGGVLAHAALRGSASTAAISAGAGALVGGVGLGYLYAKGYGDEIGLATMGMASVGGGALLGSLGGTKGAVIGAGLGLAYAAAGIYFALD